MKKYWMWMLSVLMALVVCMTGCSSEDVAVEEPPTDEEITADLAQKFFIALYTQNDALAKEVCNETGYSTYEALSGMLAMSTLGMYQEAVKTDPKGVEAKIIAGMDVVDVTIIEDTRAVVTILNTLGEKPQKTGIPLEKNADGDWKVAVTKAAFN